MLLVEGKVQVRPMSGARPLATSLTCQDGESRTRRQALCRPKLRTETGTTFLRILLLLGINSPKRICLLAVPPVPVALRRQYLWAHLFAYMKELWSWREKECGGQSPRTMSEHCCVLYSEHWLKVPYIWSARRIAFLYNVDFCSASNPLI